MDLRRDIFTFVARKERWALADQALASGSNFATSVLLARALGLQSFGILTVGWMAVLFINNLQMSLICSPMMTIGPKQDASRRPAYFGAVLFHQVAFSLTSFFLFLISVLACSLAFPDWGIHGLALPLATAAAGFLTQDFLRRYFFTVDKNFCAFANDAISYLGQLAALAYVWHLGTLSITVALWIMAATSFAAVIAGLRRLGPVTLHSDVSRNVTSHHWAFSKWLVGSALIQWTSGQIFVMVSPLFLGATVAGVLKIAQNIMGVTHVFLQAFETVVPIRSVEILQHSGAEAMRRYLVRVTRAGGIGMAIYGGAVSVCASRVLGSLYGPKYSVFGYVLCWYALIYLVTFLGAPPSAGLRALENTLAIFAANLIMAAVSIVAIPVLVPRGITGVMLGILLTRVVYQVVASNYYRSTLASIYPKPAEVFET